MRIGTIVALPSKTELQRWRYVIEINGAQGRNRTTDTVIFSHVLYQLSYLGGRRGHTAHAKTRLIIKPLGAGKRLSALRDDVAFYR